MKIAVIGDIHGIPDELAELHKLLEHESLDEIWTVGDIVDRGPDSGACVAFCREHNYQGVLGNHEAVLLEYWKTNKKPPKNPDKQRTWNSLKKEDWEYLATFPHLHAIDRLNLLLVHGGILPGISLYKQPPALTMRLQLVHPERPDHTLWHRMDRHGTSEADNRAKGYRFWTEVYDHPEDVIYGHSVWKVPRIDGGESRGTAYGIDTGGVFGGNLTAMIYPDKRFLSVKAKKVYWQMKKGDDSSYGVQL